MRIEHDTSGEVLVDEDKLWGAQTQRSLENFPIRDAVLPSALIRALGMIKSAAATVNMAQGLLDSHLGNAIAEASREVVEGTLDAHFPLTAWQTGSGTHTHMNVNEVIANRASILLGGQPGAHRAVHPNDHVNLGQSSNDTFPSAMHIACVLQARDSLLPALHALEQALNDKSVAWSDVLKIGRTHTQDAVPLTLGQEFSGYAAQVHNGLEGIVDTMPRLYALAQGGTAVGTGLNTSPDFGERVADELAQMTNVPFHQASNLFEAIAASDAIVSFHGALNAVAMSLFKIANDIRFLASGPRAGLGELEIPANEPGSSIMPGKRNPSQCEALTQVCIQVHGNQSIVSFAGSQGHFELNTYRPLMAKCVLQSIGLLADSAASFTQRCIVGIEPDLAVLDQQVNRSLMLVTALTPAIGYDKAAEIAKAAHANGTSLKEEALARGYITESAFDEAVQPLRMAGLDTTVPGD